MHADPMECDEPPRPFTGRGGGAHDRGYWPEFETEFFLGAHRLNWCWEGRAKGPLFVNLHLVLPRKGDMLPATVPIGLDSGGWDEVVSHGGWRWGVDEHVRLTRRACVELGTVRFAAIQDWLCAPPALRKTGLSVAEHQRRTTRSYLDLRAAAPEIPWCPVLQGATAADYLRHAEDFERAGVDLRAHERVMIGSIAARDDDPEIVELMHVLQASGYSMHALGAKGAGLLALGLWASSADSLAWSSRGKGIQHNLCKALGVDLQTSPAELLRLLDARELSPVIARQAGLLRRFGPDSRGVVQSLANSQAFSEYWRTEQLGFIAGEPAPAPVVEQPLQVAIGW